jgi:hypothetical protein
MGYFRTSARMQGLSRLAQPTKKPRLLSFVVSSGNERCGADHYGMLNVNMGKRFERQTTNDPVWPVYALTCRLLYFTEDHWHVYYYHFLPLRK